MSRITRKKPACIRFSLLAAISMAIFWLSLTSSPPDIDGALMGWDKAQHALAYGILTGAAGWLIVLGPLTAKQSWGLAVLYAVGFGGLLEILQAVAGTGRTCEWGDLVADAIGALFAGSIGLWLGEKSQRHSGDR